MASEMKWKLVPVESTPLMNGAGDLAVSPKQIRQSYRFDIALPICDIYAAMLAKAPEPTADELAAFLAARALGKDQTP